MRTFTQDELDIYTNCDRDPAYRYQLEETCRYVAKVEIQQIDEGALRDALDEYYA